MEETKSFDVIIGGAGPAGCACALGLKDSGLKVALIDKAVFPRDKVCGDAIPHTAVKTLASLLPEALNEFRVFEKKIKAASCLVAAPSGKSIEINFQLEGYVSRRIHFDDFLLRCVHNYSPFEVIENCEIEDVIIQPGAAVLKTSKGKMKAKVVVGCDGVNGKMAKKLTLKKLIPKHHTAAVRAYYSGIEGVKTNRMEIHLLKEYPAAYFWIFPVASNAANVGFGMLSSVISKRNINLRQCMEKIISSHPSMKTRFEKAVAENDIRGCGLPMGSQRVQVSGERFLLCGDAASLIDPATGEGIGNAMLSGQLAAETILQCVRKNSFASRDLASYESALNIRLRPELRKKYWLQRIASTAPWSINLAVAAASGNGRIRNYFQKLF